MKVHRDRSRARGVRSRSIAGAVLLAAVVLSGRAAAQSDTVPAHETFTIESRGLAERRTINVYTPPGYASSGRAFPVLYMPDGGLAEDFPHVANTIDSLIRLERIRPLVVVGIERSEEHTSELQSHSDLVCRLLLEKKKKKNSETDRQE